MYLTGQRKKYISFLIVGIMVFVTLAGAVLSAPVCVYALSLGGLRGTIASLIISLLLQTGIAPTNQEWINQLNSAYGVESTIGTIEDMISNGLLTESGGTLVDTGLSSAIESSSAYHDLGIDEIFTTVATDVGVTSASGGVNLANRAINLGTKGTIGAFAGAVAVGVGVGVLANKAIDFFQRWIKAGCPIDYPEPKDIPGGFSRTVYVAYKHFGVKTGDQKFFKSNSYSLGYYNTQWDFGYITISNDGQTTQYGYYDSSNEFHTSRITSSGMYEFASNRNNNRDVYDHMNIPIYGNKTDTIAYMESLRTNGTVPDNDPPVSPDLISPDGNIRYDEDDDTFTGVGNIVPEGHDMTPVDMTDYQNYIDQANDNTENGDINQEQGQEFSNFVDPYFVDTENQPIIPDNPNEVPTYPDRPIVPDQPTIPDKTEPSNEDIQQSLEGATTIDLRSVFPFCIPWDIYSLVLIFDTGEDREAPHITFTFPFNQNWVVDVDLAEFDPVAAVLRLLELIVFIMGLMVATRSLIGAKG